MASRPRASPSCTSRPRRRACRSSPGPRAGWARRWDGETGIIVDGRSPEETAAAVTRLLDDPVLARSMGALGRERVLSSFTWDDTVDQFRTALAKHAG